MTDRDPLMIDKRRSRTQVSDYGPGPIEKLDGPMHRAAELERCTGDLPGEKTVRRLDGVNSAGGPKPGWFGKWLRSLPEEENDG